jgi:hypothetical protein
MSRLGSGPALLAERRNNEPSPPSAPAPNPVADLAQSTVESFRNVDVSTLAEIDQARGEPNLVIDRATCAQSFTTRLQGEGYRLASNMEVTIQTYPVGFVIRRTPGREQILVILTTDAYEPSGGFRVRVSGRTAAETISGTFGTDPADPLRRAGCVVATNRDGPRDSFQTPFRVEITGYSFKRYGSGTGGSSFPFGIGARILSFER